MANDELPKGSDVQNSILPDIDFPYRKRFVRQN